MNHRKLLEFFEARRAAGKPLVLATVYETAGSTYSKAGDQMLIDEDGIFHGMLSGGCLEGDLALRARGVLESGKATSVSYDLTLDDDDLWGLGVGCDGLMRVFLQPLSPRTDYAPFAAIARLRRGHRRGAVATVIDPGTAPLDAGAAAVTDGEFHAVSGADGAAADDLSRAAAGGPSGNKAAVREQPVGGGDATLLIAIADPVPRLLILGAGLDAQPVLNFGTNLGWQCTVADHRPGYLQRGDLADAVRTVCVPAASIADELDLDAFDAAVVMSHHLVSDEHYLRALACAAVPYVGLLGPPARRARLVGSLGERAEKLEGRLHGPAGLNLGGRGPAAIALSIVAEMQQHIDGRSPGRND